MEQNAPQFSPEKKHGKSLDAETVLGIISRQKVGDLFRYRTPGGTWVYLKIITPREYHRAKLAERS